MTLPFTFYYADESETTFNASTMNVFDEDLFSFVIQHDEGQHPTLDVIVKNPRIGLLAPGRKVWVWFAWPMTRLTQGRLCPSSSACSLVCLPTCSKKKSPSNSSRVRRSSSGTSKRLLKP